MSSDSLNRLEEQVVAAAGRPDEFDILNKLAWELRDQEPDRARKLAERALDLARAQEKPGRSYLRGAAEALITLGELAISSGDYGTALNQLLEAYTLLQGQLFPDLLATASHSIGWAHSRLGNYDEALDFMNRALILLHESGNPEKEAAVLTSLGTVYSGKGLHSQAMENFQQALILQQIPEFNRGKGVTLNNLAYAQTMLGANIEAEENAKAGIRIFQNLGLHALEAKGLDTLGKAYFAGGEYEKAEESLEQCLVVARKTSSDYLEMEAMLNLGRVYYKQGRVERARTSLHQSIKIAKARQANLYLYKFHEMLAKIYEEQGDLAQALLHYKEFHTALDLALAEAASYRLENLRIIHRVEKNQKEAEVLWLNNRALEREIAERLRERAELEKLATTDPLTGLYNRRHLFTLGEYEFEKARQEEIPLSVILLDIDHFKLVNDNFSHATGDQVLVNVARMITSNARTGDICCRYGGEEFVILLPNAGLASGQEVAGRIRQVISSVPTVVAKDVIHITASLGVAQASPADEDLASVINRADQGMYQSKAASRIRNSH
jgi:diguanylate cyclase (GGDEF)-like protein